MDTETTGNAPLAQLRIEDENLWLALTANQAAPGTDPIQQALAAALLGRTDLAVEILDAPASIWRREWPLLTKRPSGEHIVLLRRLDALELAIRARDWGGVEFSYDQVLSAAQRMAGVRQR